MINGGPLLLLIQRIKITLLLISSLTVMAGATVAPALPMMRKSLLHYLLSKK